MRMYTVQLRYKTMLKNLYFQGKDAPEIEQQWRLACEKLEDVKENSKDEFEYIENAKKHFKEYGFQRIVK